MHSIRKAAPVLLVTSLLATLACNGDTSSLVGARPAAAVAGSEIVLTSSEAVGSDTLHVGDTVRLSTAGTKEGKKRGWVTWVTSDSSVASVTSDGLVTARRVGAARVTAVIGRPDGSTRTSESASLTVVGDEQPADTTVADTTEDVPGLPAPPASLVVSPSTAALVVGQTLALSATVKDSTGSVLTGEPIAWSSSNASAAKVSATGVVTAVAAGTASITAKTGELSATATVSVTAPASQDPGAAPGGIWISKAELDALPMSGSAWTGTGELKATADAAWTVQPIEQQHGQVFNVQVMAGALVFARLYPDPSAETYRKKVAQAIRDEIALPDNQSSSATAPNRNLGAWAISADLIKLAEYDPALDTRFRAWLRHKLDLPYQSSPSTIRAQLARPNNQGSWASFSLAAASAYLGDRATLDLVAQRMRRYFGDTSVPYSLRWWGDQSWHMKPADVATRVGINPKGSVRDGHNFDGIQPEDQARNDPIAYEPGSFPNAYTTRYNEVSMAGMLGAVLILHRAGYTDLLGASDQALLRAANWMKWAADNHASRGYTYFTDALEAPRPLINYFYGTGLPESRTRTQFAGKAFGYGWTYWTHAGRRVSR